MGWCLLNCGLWHATFFHISLLLLASPTCCRPARNKDRQLTLREAAAHHLLPLLSASQASRRKSGQPTSHSWTAAATADGPVCDASRPWGHAARHVPYGPRYVQCLGSRRMLDRPEHAFGIQRLMAAFYMNRAC